jgi:hypothetical protein
MSRRKTDPYSFGIGVAFTALVILVIVLIAAYDAW